MGAKAKKAEPVKADGEWLAYSILDLTVSGTEIPTYQGFDGSSILFRCWKDGDDSSVREFSMHETGVSYVYSVVCKFSSTYSFDRVQYRYTESSGNKYSEVYNQTVTSESVNKVIRGYNWLGGWTGDNWDLALSMCSNPTFSTDSHTYTLLPDVEHTRYIAEEKTISTGEYCNFYFNASSNGYCGMLDSTSLTKYFEASYGTTWLRSKVSGTFDIILDNNYSDNGVVRLKQYVDEEDTYIYYITETASATPNNIYAYGGCEQFGAWPGKAITSVTGVVDVFPDGVIHFEGVNQKIYKIPVTTGYPNGDSGIIFNYNGDESKTRNNIIAPHAGYYFSTEVEDNYVGPAGDAIEFLLDAEAIRNAVTASEDIKQYSVCGISESDAKDICDAFNLLNNTAKQYVVRTTALTYKRDGSDGNEMVTYKDILIQLSKKCGVDTGLASNVNVLSDYAFDNPSTLIIVVSVVVAISMTSLGILVVLKKRKFNN